MLARTRLAVFVIALPMLTPTPAHAYDMQYHGGCRTYGDRPGQMTVVVPDDREANLVTVTMHCVVRWDRWFVSHRSQEVGRTEATGTPTAILSPTGPGSPANSPYNPWPTMIECLDVETTDARGVYRHVYWDGQDYVWSDTDDVYCYHYQ